MSSSSSSENNKKYIGHIKSKNGGIKVVPGQKDDNIIAKRNKILNHLELVFSGGKSLKEKNISKYFKALGGKYIRNDMCLGSDSNQCRNGQKVCIGGAHKLLKLANKKDMSMNHIFDNFKESAPILYKKFESNIEGGKYSSYRDMYGGDQNNLELEKLRNEINNIRFSN